MTKQFIKLVILQDSRFDHACKIPKSHQGKNAARSPLVCGSFVLTGRPKIQSISRPCVWNMPVVVATVQGVLLSTCSPPITRLKELSQPAAIDSPESEYSLRVKCCRHDRRRDIRVRIATPSTLLLILLSFCCLLT